VISWASPALTAVGPDISASFSNKFRMLPLTFISLTYLFRAIDLDVVTMFYSAPLWGTVILASCLVGASFYDNPEQDPIPKQGTPLDELIQKWSTDVSIPRHPDDNQKSLTNVIVGIQWGVDVCPPQARQVPHDSLRAF
jgi:hypothetical protein